MKKVLAAIMVLTAYAGMASAGGLEQAGLMAGDKAEINVAAVSMPEMVSDSKMSGLPGATPFDKLKSLFAEGVPATKEDLTGWYSGRGVYGGSDAAKNKFLPAFLAGGEAALAPGGGPLFEEEKVFQVVAFASTGNPAYYDGISPDAAAGIFKNERKYNLEFPGAKWEVTDPGYKTSLELRKARGYVVLCWKYVEIKTGAIYSEGYFYFFKNVTPKI